MVRWIISKRLDAAEAEVGESVDYLRHIARVSLGAFFRFLKILPISEYRRTLPAEPFHVARIVATRDEDCGTCVQIEVNQARKAGVPAGVVRAVIAERPDDLPPELADVYRFAEAVVRASGAEAELREPVRARYGEEGLVELALALASSRFFPIVKRTLGFATACRLVQIQIRA